MTAGAALTKLTDDTSSSFGSKSPVSNLVPHPSRLPVTVVVPTLNEVDRLRACLDSVRWAAQVVVADAGSSDGTVALARRLGAEVIEPRGLTIAGQRNAAMDVATQPWVLALDADERVSPELAASIAAAVAAPVGDAYSIHFRNRYLGAPMERGGWGRDRHVRFSRATLRWGIKQVHEHLVTVGPVGELSGRMEHDSYRDLQHHLVKVTTYSAWGAADLQSKGRKAGVSHLTFRPFWRFIRCYFLQGAFLEGKRGLIFSVVHAWSAFAKYALLWDMNRRRDASAIDARKGDHAPSLTTPASPDPAPGDDHESGRRVGSTA